MINKIKIKVSPVSMISTLVPEDMQGLSAGTIITAYDYGNPDNVDHARIGNLKVPSDSVILISPKSIYMDESTYDDLMSICRTNAILDMHTMHFTYDYKKIYEEVNNYINSNLNKFSYHQVHMHPVEIVQDPLYSYYLDYAF